MVAHRINKCCSRSAIQDGDIVEINIPNRTLNVKLSDAEIKERMKTVTAPERKLTPLLESYRKKFTGVNCYSGKRVKA